MESPASIRGSLHLALAKYVEGDFRLRRGFQSLQSLGEGANPIAARTRGSCLARSGNSS
ncbi:MAG: hypothetical protein U0527_04990 [Candidatus Eisenbacteria bacterium]